MWYAVRAALRYTVHAVRLCTMFFGCFPSPFHSFVYSHLAFMLIV